MSVAQQAGNKALVALVSIYLVVVGFWLVITRQIPSPGFLRIVRAILRPPYSGCITDFKLEKGCCYIASVPSFLLSDRDSSSFLSVFEDGRLLGPPHAPHEDIRSMGLGRFSHWGTELYLSTSDNSDPRTNGRRYEVKEVRHEGRAKGY
jgi:hypothetical protein